MICNCIK